MGYMPQEFYDAKPWENHPCLFVFRCPEQIVDRQWAPRGHQFVYIFWSRLESRPLYIGRSWDPGYRLAKHRQKPWFRLADRVWVASTTDSPKMERALITELNPIYNKARPAA